jgi:F-type H+-transporting ATPase subunit delta
MRILLSKRQERFEMTDTITLARPYAKAVFEYAVEHNAVSAWGDMLHAIQLMIGHEQVTQAISSPGSEPRQLAAVLIALGEGVLDEAGKNFVTLLAGNKRLRLIDDIVQLFAALKAQSEQNITASVTTAVAVEESAQARLSAAIKQQLQCDVTLTFAQEPDLIAGAVIRMGDKVIDGSVRRQLTRMTELF